VGAQRKDEAAVLAALAERLDDLHRLDRVEAAAAPLLGNGQTREAELRRLVPQFTIEACSHVALASAGRQAVSSKLQNGGDALALRFTTFTRCRHVFRTQL
jgi:hypothetical protein